MKRMETVAVRDVREGKLRHLQLGGTLQEGEEWRKGEAGGQRRKRPADLGSSRKRPDKLR